MNLYMLLGGIAIAVAIFFGGYKSGHAVAELDATQARVTELDRIVKVQQIVIKEVPKIVTQTVTKEVTVEKEVERVITVSSHMLDPDCVLPGNFGLLLVAAANGRDPESAGFADEAGGAYDCLTTLAAILSDLRAGWRNTARLEGLQQYEKTIADSQGTTLSKASP